MLLRETDFYSGEGGAPLLMQNHGWLQKNHELAWKKTRIWSKYLLQREPIEIDELDEKKSQLHNSENNYGFKILENPDRILVKDAHRTFLTEKKRVLLVTLLESLQTLLNDYQQTMSYVSGILLLFYDVKTVFEMMFMLGRSPTYGMSGYWRGEAVAQSNDAMVLFEMIRKHNPKLYEHLKAADLRPDMFVQKWFGGLCVQCMPIEHLIDFWSQYFRLGFRYLFKFGLCLLQTLSPVILSIPTAQTHEILSVLRLDRKSSFKFYDCIQTDGMNGQTKEENKSPTNQNKYSKQEMVAKKVYLFFQTVLSEANSIGDRYNIEDIDFQKEREKAFNEYLCSSLLQAATAVTLKGFEINEDDDEEDQFKDCQACSDAYAEFYCDDCEIYLCEDCHDGAKGDHALTHAIKDLNLEEDDTVNID